MLRISLAGEFDSETVSALAKHVYPPQNRVFNFGATGGAGASDVVEGIPFSEEETINFFRELDEEAKGA